MNVYTMPNGDVELGDFPSRRDVACTNVVWIEETIARWRYCAAMGVY